MLASEIHAPAGHEPFDNLDPFPAVGIAVVVFWKADPGEFELGTVPRIHEVNAKSSLADTLDLEGHLCEYYWMDPQRLDRGDELDPIRQRRQRSRTCPGFQQILVVPAGVDNVLGQQGQI